MRDGLTSSDNENLGKGQSLNTRKLQFVLWAKSRVEILTCRSIVGLL